MLMTLMRPWNLEEGVKIRYAFVELSCEFEFIPMITNCPSVSLTILILLWWYRCSSSPSLRPKSFLRSSLLFFLFLWWFFFLCLFPPPNTSAYPRSNSVFKRTRVVSLALEKSERERIVLNINHDFMSNNLQVYVCVNRTDLVAICAVGCRSGRSVVWWWLLPVAGFLGEYWAVMDVMWWWR